MQVYLLQHILELIWIGKLQNPRLRIIDQQPLALEKGMLAKKSRMQTNLTTAHFIKYTADVEDLAGVSIGHKLCMLPLGITFV